MIITFSLLQCISTLLSSPLPLPLLPSPPSLLPLSFHSQGYKQFMGYIIAQPPMKSTCRDFWKMVHERECGVIVMLSQLQEEEKVTFI